MNRPLIFRGPIPTPSDLLLAVAQARIMQFLGPRGPPPDVAASSLPPINGPSPSSCSSPGSSSTCKQEATSSPGLLGWPGKQPVTKCYQCKASFTLLSDLNAHFIRHHPSVLQTEFEQARSWKTSIPNEIPQLQCRETSAQGGQIKSSGYPCPHCKYFAKWPTELQKHMMVHSKDRPHQCVICGLTYKWKWDLGRHFDKSHQFAANPYKKNVALRGLNADKRRKRLQKTRPPTTHNPEAVTRRLLELCAPILLKPAVKS